MKPKAGEGIGIVEAPRGTLAHRYTLTRTGRLKEIKMIIPTQVNNAAINMSVKDAASKFIKNSVIKPRLLNSVEMMIRAYDPCIKCATRSITDRIIMEIIDQEGKIIRRIETET